MNVDFVMLLLVAVSRVPTVYLALSAYVLATFLQSRVSIFTL